MGKANKHFELFVIFCTDFIPKFLKIKHFILNIELYLILWYVKKQNVSIHAIFKKGYTFEHDIWC